MALNDGSELDRLRATIELAPIGLAQFDRTGRFILVNSRFCEMLGCTREHALARTFQELTFPDDLPGCLALTQRLAAGELRRYAVDKRFVRPDGTAIWTRVTVSAVRDERGEILHFVGAAEDISEQVAKAEAQRLAEERLRSALDASVVGAFHFDVRRNSLEWAHGLDRVFGGGGKQTLEDFFAVIHPDDVPEVAATYTRSATEGVEYEDEYRVRWPDGSVHWVYTKGQVARGPDGRPSHIIGAASDITNHRRLEAAIRTREAEFATLADSIPEPSWMSTVDGARTWFNRRWYEFTGQTREEALGFGWLDAHDPALAQEALDSLLETFRKEQRWDRVVRLRRKDGEYRSFLARATPVRDRDGQVLHWIGTNTDITDRLNYEAALQDREARLRRALEVESVGVIFFDNEHRITAVNHAFARMSGYSESEAAGRVLWHDLTPVHGHDVARARAAEFDATGRTTPAEEEFGRPDGTHWWGLVTANRIGPNEGVKFVVDITGRKQAEAALADLLASEQSARERAEHEAALREQVLAIVAHDLRNPVHTIFMAAGLLADLPLNEDRRRQQLELIKRSATRMERLILDLLDMSRISAGTFSVRRSEVRVEGVLAEVQEVFEPQARARGLELVAEVEGDAPPFVGDGERLVQLLANLVGNALKFTSPGGRIALRAQRCGGSVELSVEDTGCGIAPESLPAVFDRFWQAERSGGGAGLGLAIAKGIAEAHGGRIEVASEVGKGTRFTVAVPVEPVLQAPPRHAGGDQPALSAM
jgi:PAS domain S-box-containing protein